MNLIVFIFLLLSVAGAIFKPFHLPSCTMGLFCVVLCLFSRLITSKDLISDMHLMAGPILFLLVIIPLSVLLDAIGYFESVASYVSGGGLTKLGLFVLAVVVVALFNLDAAVVLLTPIYVKIAKFHGIDPIKIAIIPALAAHLGSAYIPASNLTNLIAQSAQHFSTLTYTSHMFFPAVTSTVLALGIFLFKTREIHFQKEKRMRSAAKSLAIGVPISIYLPIGFFLANHLHLALFEITIVPLIILVIYTKRLPITSFPVNTALLALSLSILASQALSSEHYYSLTMETGFIGNFSTILIVGLISNLFNNLPVTLVSFLHVGKYPAQSTWNILFGADLGPSLLFIGTLSSLIWFDVLKRLDVQANPKTYFYWGASVVFPAFLGGALVLSALNV